MDLDSRIKDRAYIFDCFSVDEVKKYIGQVCYLSNDIAKFSDLDNVDFDVLKYIGKGYFFGGDKQYMFCLPFEFVKEKEKGYKPFDPETFEKRYNVGSVIKFRGKYRGRLEYKAIVEATTFNEKTKELFVWLRGVIYTLGELFEGYELFENGEWKPFGIKE